MITQRYTDIPPIFRVLALAILIAACGDSGLERGGGSGTESTAADVPFAGLVADPARYGGTELCTTGVYVTGFEASALGASTVTRDGILYLSEPTIWIEDASAVEVQGECSTGSTVPEYEFCPARVCGTFETGGRFGHLGGYEHQIRP
ncbi:MAG TPA: hypothetical protein VLC95_08150 [Anaerolineae bacterium]|nr:hypothetical protein [Anaerolineae bacterium]